VSELDGPIVDDLSRGTWCHWVGDGAQGRLSDDCPHICECGKFVGTFACKIRHVQVNTGWAKSAND
jgi:hypothetical protein